MARRGGKASKRSARQRKQRRLTPRPAAPATSSGEESAARSPAPATPRPATPISYSSRLSERAAGEYHYVGRDLRNIGVLVLVMAALLVAATFAFGALGIGPA